MTDRKPRKKQRVFQYTVNVVHSPPKTICIPFRTISHDKLPPRHCYQFFKMFIFWRTLVLLWGHWYPCFGLLVTSVLGFKARASSFINTWWKCMLPEIYLWCNTWRPLGSQHGSRSIVIPTYLQISIGGAWDQYLSGQWLIMWNKIGTKFYQF